jgi:hypothetical protein
MVERPSWLTVVEGGRADDQSPLGEHGRGHKPTLVSAEDTSRASHMRRNQEQEKKEAGIFSDTKLETTLVHLYLELSRQSPSDFKSSVRPERVQEASRGLSEWTVEALHRYLSGSRVWMNPSFTQAVFNEINKRMRLGNMLPRE